MPGIYCSCFDRRVMEGHCFLSKKENSVLRGTDKGLSRAAAVWLVCAGGCGQIREQSPRACLSSRSLVTRRGAKQSMTFSGLLPHWRNEEGWLWSVFLMGSVLPPEECFTNPFSVHGSHPGGLVKNAHSDPVGLVQGSRFCISNSQVLLRVQGPQCFQHQALEVIL